MFVAIFAWDGVYACVRGGFIVGPFCDVVCMIGIPNLVSLSLGLICVCG